MCFDSIKKKYFHLKNSCIDNFYEDLNLIWENCKKYNKEISDIYYIANCLQEFSNYYIYKNLITKNSSSKKNLTEIKFNNNQGSESVEESKNNSDLEITKIEKIKPKQDHKNLNNLKELKNKIHIKKKNLFNESLNVNIKKDEDVKNKDDTEIILNKENKTEINNKNNIDISSSMECVMEKLNNSFENVDKKEILNLTKNDNIQILDNKNSEYCEDKKADDLKNEEISDKNIFILDSNKNNSENFKEKNDFPNKISDINNENINNCAKDENDLEENIKNSPEKKYNYKNKRKLNNSTTKANELEIESINYYEKLNNFKTNKVKNEEYLRNRLRKDNSHDKNNSIIRSTKQKEYNLVKKNRNGNELFDSEENEEILQNKKVKILCESFFDSNLDSSSEEERSKKKEFKKNKKIKNNNFLTEENLNNRNNNLINREKRKKNKFLENHVKEIE